MEKRLQPILAFGSPRPLTLEHLGHLILVPETAAVSPIEDDGSAFLLLLATQYNYVFRINRENLARLGKAIDETLRNTASDAR